MGSEMCIRDRASAGQEARFVEEAVEGASREGHSGGTVGPELIDQGEKVLLKPGAVDLTGADEMPES